MRIQGWHPDPYERHDERWFSDGKPTRLVRDQGSEFYDEPPLEYPPEPLPPDPAPADEPLRPGQERGVLLPGMATYDDPPRRRRPGCVALALISAGVVVGIAGTFALQAWPLSRNTAASRSPAPGEASTASLRAAAPLPPQDTAGFHPTGQSPSADAEQLATAFLRAWSSGATGAAASLTDDPSAARTALAAYAQDLNLRQLTGTVVSSTAGDAAGVTPEAVTFSVRAMVAASAAPGAQSGTWSYQSALTAYQEADGTGWLIEWNPSVVAPNLTDGQHLATVLVPPPATTVTDSAGNQLSGYGDPGLANIASLLAAHAPTTAGTPGLSVQIEDSAGQAVPGSQATITPPEASRVATTISPQAERAARSAVSGADSSAMVALRPSTGDILAIANNAQFNDFALTAAVAPGSTMKIITSTALINDGLITENSPVACPATLTVQGITYSNDQGESEPAGTPFSYDFAKSCNNAFSQWWTQLNGQLASTAATYYGLDQPWDIGIPGQSTAYFSAPADATGSELAEEAFGEGRLTASPLAMASVAATVDFGQFRQPVLVAGTATVSASPLSASTDQQLKDMMRDVVTEGTAEGIGLGPGIYAKTGTADVQGQDQPNSWMVAFDPDQDIAIAVLVLKAGYGAQAAGSEVKTFFDSY